MTLKKFINKLKNDIKKKELPLMVSNNHGGDINK